MEKQLWLIRHPEVENAGTQPFNGHHDIGLSAQGEEQAERMVGFLTQQNLTRVISTGLKRTDYLGEMVAREANIPQEVEPLLKEMYFGRWEGLSAKDVGKAEPELYADCVAGDMDYRFPEGEQVQEFHDRVKRGLDKIILKTDDPVTAIITHSGVVRMALIDLLKLDFQANWRFRIDYGSLTVFEFHSDFARIRKINDTCHLNGPA